MNLLDRYLQAVAKALPRTRRDDIIEELRGNLLSQIEDREESLGRRLTEDEQADLLLHHGNPTAVAARYRDDNLGFSFGIRLIGPELFPLYKTVLLIILAISSVLTAIAAVVIQRTTGESITLDRVLHTFATQILVATLIFILIDRGRGHWLNQWDPRKLPTVKADPDDGFNSQSIFRFIALLVGAAWWAAAPRMPYLMLGPVAVILPAVPLKVMPEWTGFYWAILVLICAQLVLDLLKMLRWLPKRPARVADLILKLAGLAIGVVLLMKFPGYFSSTRRDLAEWANLSFLCSVIVAVAINLFGIGRLVLSILRDRHQMLPARQH